MDDTRMRVHDGKNGNFEVSRKLMFKDTSYTWCKNHYKSDPPVCYA